MKHIRAGDPSPQRCTGQPTRRLLVGLTFLAATLGACAHDTDRANPLDPERTPPVQLTATVDDVTGSVALAWTAYDGAAPFAQYWILRKVAGLEAVDTLAVVADVGEVTYADTTVQQGVNYSYRISVISSGGLEVSSSLQEVRALQLPGVQIRALEVDAPTATAKLTWNRYEGPRFAAYEIWRQAADIDVLIARIDDLQQVAFTDSGLLGNVPYSYRLVVTTGLAEQVESVPASGIIHPLVASWPLDLAIDETARLSLEADGRVSALIVGPGRVRLLQFDTEGQLVDERRLYERFELAGAEASVFDQAADLLPRSVSSAVDDQGRRLLVLSNNRRTWVQAWTAEGNPVTLRTGFPDVDLGALLTQDLQLSRVLSLGLAGEATASVAVDHVQVHAAGELFLEESFDVEPADWVFFPSTALNVPTEIVGGWLTQRKASSADLRLTMFAQHPGPEAVTDVHMQTTLMVTDGATAGVQLGSALTDELRVQWMINESDDLLTVASFRRFEQIAVASVPFGILSKMIYVLDVELSGDRLSAELTAPYVWAEEAEYQPLWGALGVVDGVIAVASGAERRAIGAAGGVQPYRSTAVVSEVRQWGDGSSLMGLSLPDENEVLIGRATVSSFSGLLTWPSPDAATTLHVGVGAGQGPGEFVYPLSMDRSADGRIYVLDAGNARVQVFDGTGQFITGWGTKGRGADQFDFGSGGRSIDFAGSLAVDGEGFIYVADVGNQRIQKFAP